MKYLWRSQSTVEDIFWLIELTKFKDPYVINAFIDHLVVGRSARRSAHLNGIDRDNFNKKLARLEQIEQHYQKRNQR